MPCGSMNLQKSIPGCSHRVERAVILAAGVGNRLKPLTDSTPKPLLEINGRPMIETMIEGFVSHGITEIYVVVGHLKECFEYLPHKYPGLRLIENPYYNTHNNISSLYVAREHLKNIIICDGDLILANPAILHPEFEFSGYCSVWADETNEWLQSVDDEGFVTDCSPNGGKNGWQLYSVSFWTESDAARLKNHLSELFYTHPHVYWDDIVMFLRKDEYRLQIRKILESDIAEIDTLEDYQRFLEVSYDKQT